jgi:hypothetical protein
MINIANVVLKSKDTEFTFPSVADFKVTIRYNTSERLTELRKECVKTIMDPVHGVPVEDLDMVKWNAIFSNNTIVGWKGLTWGILAELMLIDESQVDLEEEIDFSNENATTLLSGSKTFDAWVSNCLTSINNFRK